MLSYGKLGVTIFFALTLSSLVVGTTFKLWFEYDLRVLGRQLEAETIAMQKEMEYRALVAKGERAARQQELNQARLQSEADRRQQKAINAQKQRTCTFWRAEFAKTRKTHDKLMMNTACK